MYSLWKQRNGWKILPTICYCSESNREMLSDNLGLRFRSASPYNVLRSHMNCVGILYGTTLSPIVEIP